MERMQRRSILCLPKGTTSQRSMNTSIESVPSARRIRNLSATIPQQRVRTWTGLAWMACPSSSSTRTTECGEVHLRDAMFREAVADGQGPRGRQLPAQAKRRIRTPMCRHSGAEDKPWHEEEGR